MTSTLTRTILALGLCLLPLAAQSPDPSQKRSHLERLADALKLTEDQKTRLQSIQQQHQASSTPKLQAAGEARKAFREAVRKPETTEAQLKALHQAKTEKEFALLLDRRAMTGEVRGILTPEQQAQWDQRQAHRQARNDYHGGRHRRGRKG